MNILAIETSCDDTCAAVLVNDSVQSSVVSTQISFHKKFGGIVPGIARDKHKEFIDPCIKKALKQAKMSMKDIDVIGVTYGPGLAIALEVGINKAQALAREYKIPLVLVNHLEGHLLSPFLKDKNKKPYSKVIPKFPFISFIISGGHTEFVLVKDYGSYELVGQTLDDAAGEAFDKVARILHLGYPGGPVISKLAQEGDRNKYKLPKPMILNDDLNFSFSGIKTGCLIALRKIYLSKQKPKKGDKRSLKQMAAEYTSNDLFFTKRETVDFAASFEKTMGEILSTKLVKAVTKYNVKSAAIGGGVCANNYLRQEFRDKLKELGVELALPEKKFCTDNASMIGIATYHKALKKEFTPAETFIERKPTLNFKEKN